LNGSLTYYFKTADKPIVDVVISSIFYLKSGTTSETDAALLKNLNVPIIKAVLTHGDISDWQNNPQVLVLLKFP
jgi:cobalamin biosynthesis Mg chelatase CobN